jgi:hypothetical protein
MFYDRWSSYRRVRQGGVMHQGSTIGFQELLSRRHKTRHWFLSVSVMTSAMHFLAILLLGTSCMSLALSCIIWKDAILQVIRMMVNWDACMHTYIEYTWEDDDRKNPRQCPRSNHVVVAWTPPKRYSGQPAESIRTCLRQHCQSIQSLLVTIPNSSLFLRKLLTSTSIPWKVG